MATRKGATKTDSQGRRFRYDGRRWVQIKATGNGNNTTSARNRSARQGRSNATVTNSDNRRSSQSSRSNRVSNSGQRTNTGNARVTGLNAQQRRRLPRGQRGGDLARQGGERVSTGRRALPPASSTSLGRGTNQRISGTRTQGQGGNPRSTGARVTSSDNQSSRGSGSSTQQRGGQGGSRRLTGQGQTTQGGRTPGDGNVSARRAQAAGRQEAARQGSRNSGVRTGQPGSSTRSSAGGSSAGRTRGGNPLNNLWVEARRRGINPGAIGDRVAPNLTVGKLGGTATALSLLQQALMALPGPLGRSQRQSAQEMADRRQEAGDIGMQKGRELLENIGFIDRPTEYSGMADMSGDPILPTPGDPILPMASQAPQRLPVESYGGNVPAPIPMAAAAASGGVSQGPDTSVFDGMSAEQKMAAWAELFPLLASKVTPGQSGYDVINPSGPPVEQPNPAMTGEGAPRMQETPEQRRRRMMRGYPGNMNY